MSRSRNISASIVLLALLVSCKRTEYTSGIDIYKYKCAKCHKLNGKGGEKGPDLTNIFEKKDENYVRTFTQDPRSLKPDGTMPPSKLSDHELDLLIEYLKQQTLKRSAGVHASTASKP
jgi:cytochrome c2